MGDNQVKFGFPERLRRRREELRLTREELARQISLTPGGAISIGSIKNMERLDKRYVLPRRKSSGGRSMPALDLVAAALDVPVGYLLAGFTEEEIASSHYGAAVRAGRIELVDKLRDKPSETSLEEFLSALPTEEDELFKLPLYSYTNQYAFCVIFQIERLFNGLEMLIVNEPPLIMWDDDDIALWASNLGVTDKDADILISQFKDHRAYFRNLLEEGRKTYKVVLNYPTLRRFLNRKGALARQAWINDACSLVRNPNFNLVVHRPSAPTLPGIDATLPEAHECEVLCKTNVIPASLEGTVSIQIMQTPAHIKPVSYFVSPAPREMALVQREITRVDAAWAEALDQYRTAVGSKQSASAALTDNVIRQHTRTMLQSL